MASQFKLLIAFTPVRRADPGILLRRSRRNEGDKVEEVEGPPIRRGQMANGSLCRGRKAVTALTLDALVSLPTSAA